MKTATEMVNELIENGLSQAALAEKVGVKQPTIHRISKGSETSYDTGKAIELVYLELTNNPTTTAA